MLARSYFSGTGFQPVKCISAEALSLYRARLNYEGGALSAAHGSIAMFSFYMKKTFIDTVPGIELVNIHYTWTPVAQMPNWEAHRETRAMPRGGTLVRGMGGTTIDETGEVRQTQQEIIELPDDGVRRKILKL